MDTLKMDNEIINSIISEYNRAVKIHPHFPSDILHQIAVVNEESGEATRATLQYVYEGGKKEDIETELIQTAAMCIRMLKNMQSINKSADGENPYEKCNSYPLPEDDSPRLLKSDDGSDAEYKIKRTSKG